MDWSRKDTGHQRHFPTFSKLASWYLSKLNRFPALVGQLSVFIVFILAFFLNFALDVFVGIDFLDKLYSGDSVLFSAVFFPGHLMLVTLVSPIILLGLNNIALRFLPKWFCSAPKDLLALSFAIAILFLVPVYTLTFFGLAIFYFNTIP